MTCGDAHRSSVHELERLPALAPRPGRTERVRMRCRAELDRRSKRRERRDAIAVFGRRVVAPAIVAGFCLLYVVALVLTALQSGRILP